MGTFFLDSSAVVKRYVAEAGSAWVRGVMAPKAAHDLVLCRITAVEVVSALVRHVPNLSRPHLARALGHFHRQLQNRFRIIL